MTTKVETADAAKYGEVKDGKVILKAYMGFADRIVGEVKISEEIAITYFVNKFHKIAEKVDQLVDAIHAEQHNKGSFLMKLVHMREQLATYDGIGDFEPLFKKLDEAEVEIQQLVAANRVRNLEIKTALIAEIEAALEKIEDWSEASELVKSIKDRWLKTGAVLKEKEQEFEETFEAHLNSFYTRRKEFYDERARVIEERVAKYQVLLDRLRELVKPEKHAGHALKEYKLLQDEWKTVGAVPKLYWDPFFKELKGASLVLLNNMKNQKAAKGIVSKFDQVLMDNLKAKQAMIDEARGLVSLDLREAYGKAKELQAKWKDLGNVPVELKNKVNDDFTYACDRIFEMSYLMRTVYTQFRFFNSKSLVEQYTIKISLMKDIIKKDEIELKQIETQYGYLNDTEQKSPNGKLLYSRQRTQKRKLGVKNQLLREMEAQLSAFK